MSRTQTMVQLTDDLIAQLDIVASQRGISRSALIREVLTDHLADLRARDIGRQIAEGYEQVPPYTPDSWGPVETHGDRGAVELMARLDAEEARAGHEPW